MITIENGDDVARRHADGVVEVARLGMLVFRAVDIARTHLHGKIAKGAPPPVIKDVNIELIRRPVHAQAPQHRGADDRDILVIGGHIDIDNRPCAFIFRHGVNLPAQRPCQLK